LVDAFLSGGFAQIANNLAIHLDVDFLRSHGTHENERVEEAVESLVVDLETHVFNDVFDQE